MTDTTVAAVRDILDMPPVPVRRATFIPVEQDEDEVQRLRATILDAVAIWDAAQAEILDRTLNRHERRGYIYQAIDARAALAMVNRLRQDAAS